MTATATSAIAAEGVSKRFGAVNAVENVTLSVPAGITFGLLGPSGCGKTTLIRLLLGLLQPSAGAVRVEQRNPADPAVRARVGYMPQTAALYAELSARQNIAFFAGIYGVRDPRRVAEVLRLVELLDRADARVSELSGGMRARASLGCALVHEPALLFLDEPTVGVDPRLRAAFWSYFRDLNRRGVTIVVTSHIMDEAERCDRLGMMRAGRLIAEGSPAELRAMAGVDTLEDAFLKLAGDAPEGD